LIHVTINKYEHSPFLRASQICQVSGAMQRWPHIAEPGCYQAKPKIRTLLKY